MKSRTSMFGTKLFIWGLTISQVKRTFIRLYPLKVKNDHRSKFSNLSNWKEEA